MTDKTEDSGKVVALQTYAGRIKPIVPQSLPQCVEIADQFASAGMFLAGTDRNPEQKRHAMLVVAFMKALDIGKTPAWALEYIYVVNNKPCLYGDGPMMLANESGLVEYTKEWIAVDEETGDLTAFCEIKRNDRKEPTLRKFSTAHARKANLWGKSGPWTQYPDRMLQLRARTRCIRDAVPEALGGFQVREEVEDYIDVTPTVVDTSTLDDSPVTPNDTPENGDENAKDSADSRLSVGEIVERLENSLDKTLKSFGDDPSSLHNFEANHMSELQALQDEAPDVFSTFVEYVQNVRGDVTEDVTT